MALAPTKQRGSVYSFSVLGTDSRPTDLPEDGRLFAHLCDTAGEEWSRLFYGLLYRTAGAWAVDGNALRTDLGRLLAAYRRVHPRTQPGAPSPALVEYWIGSDDRTGSHKLDAVLGMDLREPIALELKTSLSYDDPANLDAWRDGWPADRDRLDRDARLLADDTRRPVRTAVLFLSAKTREGMFGISSDAVRPGPRPPEPICNIHRRRIWLRADDLDWLEEFTPTWVTPALLEP